MSHHWLLGITPVKNLEKLNVFLKHLPSKWINTILKRTGKDSIRRRKLPAEFVVRLNICMGLYRDRSIQDIVEKVDLILPSSDTIAPSAVPQARQRLTEKPMEELFSLTAKHWCEAEEEDRWNGLKLFSVDGTVFKCSDTPELREHFTAIKHRKDRSMEYPSVRLCAFTSLRSRMISNVALGPCKAGENTYARKLTKSLPDHSLTIFDRCYMSAELLINWQRSQESSHWMLPIKKNTRYTIIETLGENDYIVEMKVLSKARKLDPTLPKTWKARLVVYPLPENDNQLKGILSSLTDDHLYSAQQIRDVYFERWEIETTYGEIKHILLQDRLILRSQLVSGIYQEIWGILIAYNLVRMEASSIAKKADISSLRISFMTLLRDIKDMIIYSAISGVKILPKKLQKLYQQIKRYILPNKRKRPKSRTVRCSKTKYAVCLKYA